MINIINLFKNNNQNKKTVKNNFLWKNFGIYYSLPIFHKHKLRLPKIKVSYRFRGHYYEKVVKDVIRLYSSAFLKDSSERLKHISMIKKHFRILWVDENDEYLDYDLCDMIRISYKHNNVLHFVARHKIMQGSFWIFTFSPRRNYQIYLKSILNKQKLFCYFYRVSTLIKKKLYSFFKINPILHIERKQKIFLVKLFWNISKYILLTSTGYIFVRKGSYWFTIGVFSGLFYILKGPAKWGVKSLIRGTYLLFIAYYNFFLQDVKDEEIQLTLIIYSKLSKFMTYSILSTYKSQKINHRISNKFLVRIVQYHLVHFSRFFFKFNNYLKIVNSLKFIGNYFFFLNVLIIYILLQVYCIKIGQNYFFFLIIQF